MVLVNAINIYIYLFVYVDLVRIIRAFEFRIRFSHIAALTDFFVFIVCTLSTLTNLHGIRNGDVRNGACLEPRAIAKAPEGQGCPRCGGFVYAAEQMLARGRVGLINSSNNFQNSEVNI